MEGIAGPGNTGLAEMAVMAAPRLDPVMMAGGAGGDPALMGLVVEGNGAGQGGEAKLGGGGRTLGEGAGHKGASPQKGHRQKDRRRAAQAKDDNRKSHIHKEQNVNIPLLGLSREFGPNGGEESPVVRVVPRVAPTLSPPHVKAGRWVISLNPQDLY